MLVIRNDQMSLKFTPHLVAAGLALGFAGCQDATTRSDKDVLEKKEGERMAELRKGNQKKKSIEGKRRGREAGLVLVLGPTVENEAGVLDREGAVRTMIDIGDLQGNGKSLINGKEAVMPTTITMTSFLNGNRNEMARVMLVVYGRILILRKTPDVGRKGKKRPVTATVTVMMTNQRKNPNPSRKNQKKQKKQRNQTNIQKNQTDIQTNSRNPSTKTTIPTNPTNTRPPVNPKKTKRAAPKRNERE